MNCAKTVLSAMGASSLIAGCTPDYIPMEGYEVTIKVISTNLSWFDGDSGSLCEVNACIKHPESGPSCGYRRNPDEACAWDYFAAETNEDERAFRCFDAGYGNTLIQGATCKVNFKDAAAGQTFRVTVNDFTESTVTLPPAPALTSPEQDAVVSVSAKEDVVLAWEPGAKGDELTWGMHYMGDNLQSKCASDISWDSVTGELDDTGSFAVPKDLLPANIPAEGCPVGLSATRRRPGRLDSGIKEGQILGTQIYRVRMTLMP